MQQLQRQLARAPLARPQPPLQHERRVRRRDLAALLRKQHVARERLPGAARVEGRERGAQPRGPVAALGDKLPEEALRLGAVVVDAVGACECSNRLWLLLATANALQGLAAKASMQGCARSTASCCEESSSTRPSPLSPLPAPLA